MPLPSLPAALTAQLLQLHTTLTQALLEPTAPTAAHYGLLTQFAAENLAAPCWIAGLMADGQWLQPLAWHEPGLATSAMWVKPWLKSVPLHDWTFWPTLAAQTQPQPLRAMVDASTFITLPPPYQAWVETYGSQHTFWVALQAQQNTLGVLSLVLPEADPASLMVVQQLAHLAALLLAHHHACTRTDVAQRQTQATLRVILNSVRQSFILFNFMGQVQQFNQMAQEHALHIFGQEVHEGVTFAQLASSSTMEDLGAYFSHTFSGQTSSLERSFTAPTGETVWFDIAFVPILDSQTGDPMQVCFTAIETTARRHAEQVILASEARYRSLLQAVPDFLLVVDENLVFQDYHASRPELLLVPPEQFLQQPLTAILPPPLAAQTTTALRHTFSTQQMAHLTYQMTLPHGQHHFEARIVPAENRQALIVIRDITDQVRAEARLQQVLQAVEQTAEAVAITDTKAIVEYVNPAFATMSGYQSAEIVGQSISMLKSGLQNHKFYQALWTTIQQGYPFHGLFVNRRKDGSLYPEEKTISPIRNAQGTITHYISTSHDLTERQAVEAQLLLRHRQVEILNRMGQAVVSSQDQTLILREVIENARTLCNARGVSVLLRVGEELVFTEVVGDDAATLQGVRMPANAGIAGQVLESGLGLIVDEEALRRQVYATVGQAATRAITSLIAAPITFQEEQLGVIEAVRVDTLVVFTPDDLQVLETTARWAALAIHNARQHAALEQRLREQDILAAISRALNETLDLAEVLQMIVDAAQRLLPAVEHAILHTYNDAQQVLEPAAGTNQTFFGQADLHFQLGQGIAGRAAQLRQAINVADILADPRYLNVGRATHLRSLLAVPIQTGTRLLGVLSVQSAAPGSFSADDVQMLGRLGVEAALAIDKARLFYQERQQLEAALALKAVFEAIGRYLEEATMLQTVVQAIASVQHYYFVGLLKAENGQLQRVAHAANPADLSIAIPAQVPASQGVIGRVMRTGQAALVPDVTQDPDYINWFPQTHSLMAIPLKRGPQFFGVLSVNSNSPHPLTQANLDWLNHIGQQLGIALENAQLYAEQRQLLREREQAQSYLIHNEKMAALGRLVASLAHEINNPLQSLQGCLTLAHEELHGAQRTNKLDRFLTISLDEVDRIATLVGRMREFYRPARTNLQYTDLQTLLELVLELVAKQLQHADIQLQKHWLADFPPVEANPDHLKQVFLNLVINAIDAMPQGGTLTLSTTLALTRLAPDQPLQPMAHIHFRDTGVGIPPSKIPHLFEPFFTLKAHGSGLGLYISLGIIQAHQGGIVVESQEGQGTLFTVLLPLQQSLSEPEALP